MARETFEMALAAVLRHEGGYADHPSDPGGATMMGITLATLSAWRGREVSKAEIRALKREEAAAIYRSRYWDAVRGDALPSGLDLATFDLAVNSGPGRAVRLLQTILGVPVDGRLGPVTLRAAMEADAAGAIRALSAVRLAFLKRLQTFPVFGRGWTRRVTDIEKRALDLAPAANVHPPKPKETNPMDLTTLDLTKTILASRTVWANGIGFAALALSWLGFDTSSVDKTALTDNLLQIIAGVSFIASTLFRVIATRRLV